jgi:NAD(P)-dependent dehydrogenase (short-subunit alcohol dehydrogenase family)
MMKLDFTGKRVLVTGGTRGIGLAIVEAFLEAGARVAVNGSSEQSVAGAISRCSKSDSVVPAPGSMATVDGCRKAVEAAQAGLGGLDVLVNNAGVWHPTPVASADEQTWDAILDINLKGAFFVTKYALSALKVSKGNIVNIASVSGIAAEPDATAYCVSKAGLIQMTRCNAMEFAPDIRVNAVCPGPIDTSMLQRGANFWSGTVEEGYKMLSEATMLKRVGQVRNIAGPVLYLASDLASYVTGVTHVVDGGMTID